jgi:hypothetical protein
MQRRKKRGVTARTNRSAKCLERSVPIGTCHEEKTLPHPLPCCRPYRLRASERPRIPMRSAFRRDKRIHSSIWRNFYNRTRDNYKEEGNPKSEEYVVMRGKARSMRDAHISGEFCIASKAFCTTGAKHASNTKSPRNDRPARRTAW